MSSILRGLRRFRNDLRKSLTKQPAGKVDFDSPEAKDEHLVSLDKYKEELSSKRATFFDLYRQLLTVDCNGDEDRQKELDDQIDSDSDFLIEVDKAIADVSALIKRISKVQPRERAESENGQNGQRVQMEPVVVQPVQSAVRENGDRGQIAQVAPAQVPPIQQQMIGVRLPKLELPNFEGNASHWPEFWGSFESAIHQNASLSPIDKMNYLKAQLVGEAKKAISGLASTAENYNAAIEILRGRFGNSQLIVDSHYTALTNLAPATNSTVQLRSLYDSLEQHFHSLATLGEDIENRQTVSIIKSKLPSNVLFQLEERNDGAEWTVARLRERLGRFVVSREMCEAASATKPKNDDSGRPNPARKMGLSKSNVPLKATTGALLTSERARHHSKQTRATCVYCGGEHWSDRCTVYSTLDERRQKIRGNCFGCLASGHLIHDCTKVKPCYFCKKEKAHHQSLCPAKFGTRSNGGRWETTAVAADCTPKPALDGHGNSTTTVSACENMLLASDEQVILQTARVKVSSDKYDTSARLLLDSASQRCYISQALATKLKLKPILNETLSVFTFGCTQPRNIGTSVVELNVDLIDGQRMKIQANVVPTITGQVQRVPVRELSSNPLFKNFVLADPPPLKCENTSVDLLIGMDCYWNLITSERISISDGLHLIGSKFGWIVCGKKSLDIPSRSPTTTLFVQTVFSSENSLVYSPADAQLIDKIDVKKFRDFESIGIKDCTRDLGDEEALQNFNETTRFEKGRYLVKWPWKSDNVDLPSNFNLALGRLNSMLRRCRSQPEVFSQYKAVLDEQIRLGIIESVDVKDRVSHPVHYLPHHAVLTPRKETTKLRVVYDASAKAKRDQLSLNECLYRG